MWTHAATRLVVFANNAGGSRMYGVAPDGRVYVLRGLLTTRPVAGSVLAFLQHLLV
jgi:hypothetical protein